MPVRGDRHVERRSRLSREEGESGDTGWFSPVPMGCTIRFEVLIGGPGSPTFAVPLYSDVGSVEFSNGGQAWVCASVTGPDDEYEARLAQLRRAVIATGHHGPGARSWMWGESQEDHSPLLMDFSNLVLAS
jgi:hypothetical protein